MAACSSCESHAQSSSDCCGRARDDDDDDDCLPSKDARCVAADGDDCEASRDAQPENDKGVSSKVPVEGRLCWPLERRASSKRSKVCPLCELRARDSYAHSVRFKHLRDSNRSQKVPSLWDHTIERESHTYSRESKRTRLVSERALENRPNTQDTKSPTYKNQISKA